jgi:hypothetical protein
MPGERVMSNQQHVDDASIRRIFLREDTQKNGGAGHRQYSSHKLGKD